MSSVIAPSLYAAMRDYWLRSTSHRALTFGQMGGLWRAREEIKRFADTLPESVYDALRTMMRRVPHAA